MSDPYLQPVETRSGDRPSSTVAERGAVALAVLALAGGIFIAVGNWLGTEDGPATASGSPVAVATPGPSSSSTPAPTPTPREIVLLAGEPPASVVPEQPWVFNGWIRALAEQPYRTSANPSAPELGTLHAGDVTYAEDVEEATGWLRITGEDLNGYVEELDGTTALIERIAPEPHMSSGDLWEVVAGANGFLVRGYAPAMNDRASPQLTAFSADGASWQATDLPAFAYSVSAWGPAGWMVVGVRDEPTGPTAWVFRSADGIRWDSLGGAPPDSALTSPGELIASERGYLLQTWGSRGGGAELWFSSDGVTWVESAVPAIPGGFYVNTAFRLRSVGAGFYLWTPGSGAAGNGEQAFSADGRHWTLVENGPEGVNLKLTTLGDRVIAAITDPDDGSVRFRTGVVAGPTLTWDAEQPAQEAHPGVGVAALVSDGSHLVAILWDRATDQPRVWESTDAVRWRPSQPPSGAFGGIPRVVAGGPAGVVLVGYRPTVRGPNPILWREVGTGWAAEASPLIPIVPDPPASTCDPPPEDFLDFTALDRSRVADCFGSVASFTFRAWSVPCEDCYYEEPGVVYDPAWLANPTTNQLFLAPIASDVGDWQAVVTHPTLAIDPAWTEQWLEVTGHFDDPVANSCRFTSPPAQDEYYSGREGIVDTCRQQFVVTAVRLVEGP